MLSGGNWVFSIIVFIVTEIIILKIADFTAPAIQKHFGLPENVSFTQFASACCAVVGATLGKLLAKIPKLKDIKADPRSLKEKFGLFGDPYGNWFNSSFDHQRNWALAELDRHFIHECYSRCLYLYFAKDGGDPY